MGSVKPFEPSLTPMTTQTKAKDTFLMLIHYDGHELIDGALFVFADFENISICELLVKKAQFMDPLHCGCKKQ